MTRSIRVLFICIENAGRSQMAEAFMRQAAPAHVESYSAGSRPAGKINPVVVSAMQEVGCDLGTHHSKTLAELPAGKYDYVVTMGCGDECPFIPADRHIDWNIPDPKGLPLKAVRPIRDLIKVQVEELVEAIGKDHA